MKKTIILHCLVFGLSIPAQLLKAQSYEDEVVTLVDSLPQAVGGVAVDALGYIYLADFEETVWQVNPISREMIVFANGFYGASGNNFDSYGNLYQANFYGNYISRISRRGEVEIFADSIFRGPVGIAINSKNELFVCNCYSKSISKVSIEGEVKEFVKSELLRCPNGIALDASENLFVVSYYNNNIVKITPDGVTSLFATTKERLGNGHIAIANNILYVTGFHGHQVYQITMDGTVSILAGTGDRGKRDGASLQSKFSYPNGIAVSQDQKTLYINDLSDEIDLRVPALTKTYSSLRTIRLRAISDILKEEIDANGLKGAHKLYQKTKQHSKYRDKVTRGEIHRLGNNYMIAGKYKEAKALFQMNIETYPDWFVSYTGMGWTLYLEGKNKEAIGFYKKALDLNPKDTGIIQRLEKLEE